ncbi:MAG: ATP-binding protein [Rhodobacteraceae bacterium]|nr:ATP-binding protein [Paracoccaceae bacterium]
MILAEARVLLDALPLPAILIGADARIRAANPAARQLFGTDGEGRHYMLALRAPGLVDCIDTALRRGTAAEAMHLATDRGRESRWRVHAAPLPAGQGALISFTDETATEAAERMRRDFVANVSHELKTPLTALIGFIETLRGAARDDAAVRDRFLAIMEREAGRMSRLVDDLLSLTRVEGEERVRPTGRVEIAPLLAGVVAPLRPQAEERGVEITVAGAEPGLAVIGDADQLTQVFANLIENALKYGASGKVVALTVTEIGRDPALRTDAVRIDVADQGEGFDPIHIPRLTERFYRIDNHRSRSEGGTGLGLAIVKHIVSRHRGRLAIWSEKGQGAVFSVILPQAGPPSGPAAG